MAILLLKPVGCNYFSHAPQLNKAFPYLQHFLSWRYGKNEPKNKALSVEVTMFQDIPLENLKNLISKLYHFFCSNSNK